MYELLDTLETARVRLAALKLADGDVEQLRAYLVERLYEWRDLLSKAEYTVGNRVSLSRRYLADVSFREAVDARLGRVLGVAQPVSYTHLTLPTSDLV